MNKFIPDLSDIDENIRLIHKINVPASIPSDQLEKFQQWKCKQVSYHKISTESQTAIKNARNSKKQKSAHKTTNAAAAFEDEIDDYTDYVETNNSAEDLDMTQWECDEETVNEHHDQYPDIDWEDPDIDYENLIVI